MKKILFIMTIFAVLSNASCESLKTTISGAADDKTFKSKFKAVETPKNVKNAKLDAHAKEESAIIITMVNDMLFVGEDLADKNDYSTAIGFAIYKNPDERRLIYLNIHEYTKYEPIMSVLHKIRSQEVENIGLMVQPEADPGAPFYVLKAKLLPEPKLSLDDEESKERRKMTFLNISKEGGMNFAKQEEGGSFTVEKDAISPEEIEAKIRQLFKEREENKTYRTGTSEIDKRIFVRPAKTVAYEQIVQMIDAATSAGADVYLEIDNTP